MIDLRVNGASVVLLPGTTVPMELLNSALASGLEDSFSLPFEAPVEGNEDTLGHAHVLARRGRTVKWTDASLHYQGALKHRGVLYLENVENGVVQLSFSVDGFVALLKDRTLKEVDYGGRISITDQTSDLLDWAQARNQQSFPDSSHCFPMFFNPDLQASENPFWYPNQQPWSSTQAYAVNDLVSFEEGTTVRRTVGYQCIASTSAGQSPATHPGKWRRTAFGLVNHWDHVNAEFFENNPTDGNAYAMVPFFYLKWVLQKVYADLGYTVEGTFLTDPLTHPLALYNNTALDDGSRAGYFCVTHSVPQSMPITPQQLLCNTDSGGAYTDPDDLWNTANGRFTCPSAGRRYFEIKLNVSLPTSGRIGIGLLNLNTSTIVKLEWVTPVTDSGGNLITTNSYSDTYNIHFDFQTSHIGQEFVVYLFAQAWSFLPGGPLAATVNSVTITSWQVDALSILNRNALVIDPRDHVPDQAISAFILDVCDLFTLERTYDHAGRRAFLNYRAHVLTDRPADITGQVRSAPVIRYQESPRGYRFAHQLGSEGEVDLTGRTREPDVDTEADLATPPTARSYVVVRNSQRLYVSRFGADGDLYWYPAGWDVPAATIGDAQEATEVSPGLGPMGMDLVVSNGEEFLVPTISEAGNSAMYGTTGKAPSLRLVFYHGVLPNANLVEYPFASSWNMGHDGGSVHQLSLLWQGSRGLLPTLAPTYFERLAGCEVLECDLEADGAVLAAVNNKPVLYQHQRCLLERLPLTYGDGTTPLTAQGARLYRLPPP